MMTLKFLTAFSLAAFSVAAFAGKAGTPLAGSSGSGGVIGNEAIDQTLGGAALDIQGGITLYNRLRVLAATIVLEDGSVVSPDTRLPNGTVIILTVEPDGTIRNVERVEREPASERAGGACGA